MHVATPLSRHDLPSHEQDGAITAKQEHAGQLARAVRRAERARTGYRLLSLEYETIFEYLRWACYISYSHTVLMTVLRHSVDAVRCTV